MPIDILTKEASVLPDEYVDMAISYVRFLQTQYFQEKKGHKGRALGILSDKFHSIAEDFDETPECFEEYPNVSVMW